MSSMVEVIARLSGSSGGMVAAFGEAQAAQERFAATSERVAARAASSSNAMASSIQKVALVGGVALAAVAVVAVDMAAKFEKSTELLQTAGGLTQANLQKARDGILAISQSTGVAAHDLSEGMYIVSKVTKDAGDGLMILKAAAQGAVAEGVNMSVMTTALTSVMTTYNLSAKDAVSTENGLVAAAGASKTTMQEFAGSLSTVLPIAQSAHLSFAQVAGAIATMTQHGTSAAEATQELRNGIQNFLAPNQVAIKEMSQLGISSIDVAKNLGKRGLTGTVQMLTEATLKHMDGGLVMLGTFKKSQQAAQALSTEYSHMPPALQKISSEYLNGTITSRQYTTALGHMDANSYNLGRQFATLYKASNGFSDVLRSGSPAAQTFVGAMSKMTGGTTGLQVAMMLGGDNMAGYLARTKEIGDAMKKTGADISTNADTQKTLAATTARLKATFEVLMIQLGTSLIPAFLTMVQAVQNVVMWFQKNEKAAQALGVVILSVVGTFLAVWTALKLWAIILPIVTLAVNYLKFGMIALDMAMEANPIGLVVAALSLLVAGVILAYNNIGWFKDGVNAAFKFIKEAAANSINWIKDVGVPWLIAAWKNTVTFFQNSVGMFKDFFTNTVGMFSDFFKHTNGMVDDFRSNTIGMFKDFFKNTGGMFLDYFKHTLGMFTDFGKNTVGMISDWGKNTFGMFSDWGKKVGKGFIGWWHDPIGETKKFDTQTNQIITAWVTKTLAGFKGWDTDVNKSMTDWSTKQKTTVSTWDANTNKTITAWVNKTLQGFKGWDTDTNKTMTDWWNKTMTGFKSWDTNSNNTVNHALGGQKGSFKSWDADTNKTVNKWVADTLAGFQGWDKDSNRTISTWASGVGTTVKNWDTNTNSTITAWVSKTIKGFTSWSSSQSGIMSAWKNQTTGETRKFADDAERNLNDFNRTTNGMFIDFFHRTAGMFSDFFRNTIGMFSDFIGHVHDAWVKFNNAGMTALIWIRSNVFNPIGSAIRAVGTAFDSTAAFIATAWSRIKDAAAGPVRFIVNTVYTNGIQKVWNGIASAVGLNLQLPNYSFASGGIMPGYSPGHDNQLAAVSGGEAIMRPEWTRAIGSEKVHAMNAMARSGNMDGIRTTMGLSGFASGGIVGNIGSFIGGAAHNVGNFIGGAITKFADFFADPAKWVANMIKGPVQGLLGMAGGGNFGKMIGALPIKVIESLTGHAKGDVASSGAGANFIAASSVGSGVQRWTSLVLRALSQLNQPASLLGVTLRRMNQESGGNPNAVNNWDSNAALGDPSKGLMQVIGSTFRAYAPRGFDTNIFDPYSNILASMNYAIARYGSLAGAYNQAGGYANGGIVPTFDNGGWVQPGLNIIHNKTGAPEHLSNTTNGGGDMTIVLDIPELGGRLTARIKEVTGGTISDLNRSLKNSGARR